MDIAMPIPVVVYLYPVKKWYKTKEAEELLNIPGHYFQLQYKRGYSLLGLWTTKEIIDKNPDLAYCDDEELERLSSLDILYSTPYSHSREKDQATI